MYPLDAETDGGRVSNSADAILERGQPWSCGRNCATIHAVEISEKIEYWLDIASYDLETARKMQESGRYLYTVFMCQQSMEKMLKAIHLRKLKKEAPLSHNLVYLESVLSLGVDDVQRSLLAELTTYYIEGRYPTYKAKLSTLVDESKGNEVLLKTEGVIKWLKETVKLSESSKTS